MGASGGMAAFMGASAIGSLTTAYSQHQAMLAEGDYKESISRTNAKIANLEANQTIEAGNLEAARKNAAGRQVVGSLRAVQGASGTDVASGSNALTRVGAEYASTIDEMTIRNNAMRRAWGFKTQAINDSFAGQFSKMTAVSTARQTLLTGGLQAIEGPLGIYANYKRWSSRYSGGSGEGVPFDMSTAPVGTRSGGSDMRPF